jgi:hypothetical protein
MSFILNNKERNWKDIKNQIVKFRKEVKRNRLNDMSTKLQLPYLPHAMKVEVEH